MIFAFPTKKVNDRVWALSDTDEKIFGTVKLITMAISESECNVYYHLDCGTKQYTIKESQVVDTNDTPLVPKYSIGDFVKYSFTTAKNTTSQSASTIIAVSSDKYLSETGTIEDRVLYYMEEDPNYFVMEHEILGFGEPVLEMANAYD